jgi:hypothetical protein
MMNDKRKHHRFSVSLPAVLKQDDPTATPLNVTVVDVSAGGLCLMALQKPPTGILATLTWNRPPFAAGMNVTIKCRILNSHGKPTAPGKFAVNIAYEDTDPSATQKLLSWAQLQYSLKAKARTYGAARTQSRSFY